MMWLAYAKAGKEFEVVQSLADEGITAHCAQKIEVKRVGKRRKPDVFITPLLPNYIFIDCEAAQYLAAVATKHLAGTMTVIPTADATAVNRFLMLAQLEFDERTAKIDAGERLDQFSVGEALKVLEGPLAGLTATFRGIVERDRDIFPSIAADVDMMGQTVRVELDPITVRAAE